MIKKIFKLDEYMCLKNIPVSEYVAVNEYVYIMNLAPLV